MVAWGRWVRSGKHRNLVVRYDGSTPGRIFLLACTMTDTIDISEAFDLYTVVINMRTDFEAIFMEYYRL